MREELRRAADGVSSVQFSSSVVAVRADRSERAPVLLCDEWFCPAHMKRDRLSKHTAVVSCTIVGRSLLL